MHSAVPELSVAIEELVRFVRRLSPDTGLSLTAAATLSSLDRNGPARLTELAVRQGVTQPAMTQLVTRLQEAGFVERRPDRDDGRVVRVHITDAGLTELSRRRGVRTERLGELFDRLTHGHQATLVAALPAIRALTTPASAAQPVVAGTQPSWARGRSRSRQAGPPHGTTRPTGSR
jgi:DNA-binding MarR family transcriptional regulator